MTLALFRYRVFGLNIEADRIVEGLVPSDAPQADLRIEFGHAPPALQELLERPQRPLLPGAPSADKQLPMTATVLEGGAYYQLRYDDGTRFVIARDGCYVWASNGRALSDQDTDVYLIGPVLGFVLRLRGTVALHASAILIDGKAVGLMGPAGAGKSSTAAAFAQAGHVALTEDVLALVDLDGSFAVHLGSPRIKLWDPTVNALFGSSDRLPLIVKGWEKRFLETKWDEIHTAVPLAAIYLLGEREPGLGSSRFSTIEGQEKMISMVANTYTNYLLDEPMRAHEFSVLKRLAGQVLLRKVILPDDLSRLPDLPSQILADYRKHQTSQHGSALHV